MKHVQRTYRRALVTGATSGIGEAFARALPIETGLLLTGRNQEVLSKLRQELERAGRPVETIAADLGTDAGCDSLIQTAKNFEIDLFICNAGQGPYGAFLTTPEADLKATVAVNVTAVMVLLRALVPGMVAQARLRKEHAGVIVTSSEVGFFPVPNLATYAASKAFDLSLTEALAAELSGDPIDVLALCPSATRSDFGKRSGFGRNIPGAQDPGVVVKGALRALGNRRTYVAGPVSGSVLSVPALVRASIAESAAFAQRMSARFS